MFLIVNGILLNFFYLLWRFEIKFFFKLVNKILIININCVSILLINLEKGLVLGRYNEWRKFGGILFVIKDNFCIKDIRTTCVFYILNNYVFLYIVIVV